MQKQKEIKKQNISKILVAISGGSDSMALLHVLHTLKYDVTACYIDHKQRPKENIIEKKIIKDFCKEKSIPFFIEVINKKIPQKNLQDFFRIERYNLLANEAVKLNIKYIALAHHKDDQLETVFMREIKNPLSNKNYLIKKITKYKNKLYLLRPFLEFNKKDILLYCKINNISFFNDSSNYKDIYLRNKIRNRILPNFKKINNKFCDNYLKSYQNKMDYISYLNTSITLELKNIFLNNQIEVKKLNDYLHNKTYSIKILVIEILLNYFFNLSYTSNKIINLIIDLLDNFDIKEKYIIQLKKNIYLKMQYGYIYIVNNNYSNKLFYDNKAINLSFQETQFYNYKVYLSYNIVDNLEDIHFIKLPYILIKEKFIVKFPQRDDFLYLKNGRKKINRLYIDKKILFEKRFKTPIISTITNPKVILYDILTRTIGYNALVKEDKKIFYIIIKKTKTK